MTIAIGVENLATGWKAKAVMVLRSRKMRLVALGLVSLISLAVLAPRGLMQSALGAVQSPLTMLDGRGPGGRTGALTTTKPPKAFMARVPQGSSPYAGTRSANPPSANPPSAYLAQVPGYGGTTDGPVQSFPIIGTAGLEPGGTVPSSIDVGPVPSALVAPQASINPNAGNPITGVPSNPGVPGNPGIPDVPTTTPGAVPELSSWAMMILGLFGTSALLRRDRSRKRLAEVSAHA